MKTHLAAAMLLAAACVTAPAHAEQVQVGHNGLTLNANLEKADGNWPDDHGQDLTDFFVKHGKTSQDLQALIDALPDEVDEAGHLLPTDLVLRVDEPGPALDRSLVDRLGDGLVDLPPVREDGS